MLMRMSTSHKVSCTAPASEGITSGLLQDAVGHPQAEAAMSSASPEPYMAQGTENRSADGGMSELSYGSAAPAGYGYGGDMQPQMDAALHWNIGGDNRASVRFAR